MPLSKLHLAVALALQKQGFISSVELGGPNPPLSETLRIPDVLPEDAPKGRSVRRLAERPWDAYPLPGKEDESFKALKALDERRRIHSLEEDQGLDEQVEDDTDSSGVSASSSPALSQQAEDWPYPNLPRNPAARRLWLGLKYYNNQPVLSKMRMVSKPTKRIWLNKEDIGRITRGREAGYVRGLSRPGECLFVTTDAGVMESRECVDRMIGGMMLCRVY